MLLVMWWLPCMNGKKGPLEALSGPKRPLVNSKVRLAGGSCVLAGIAAKT